MYKIIYFNKSLKVKNLLFDGWLNISYNIDLSLAYSTLFVAQSHDLFFCIYVQLADSLKVVGITEEARNFMSSAKTMIARAGKCTPAFCRVFSMTTIPILLSYIVDIPGTGAPDLDESR
jgi:hypothetical protein